jgi:hypothetical protein
MKDGISSEPSWLTIPHYTTGAYNDIINAVDAAKANACYQLGLAPSSWLKSTDCSLFKKKKMLNVEGLRFIGLFAADANMNNKKLG